MFLQAEVRTDGLLPESLPKGRPVHGPHPSLAMGQAGLTPCMRDPPALARARCARSWYILPRLAGGTRVPGTPGQGGHTPLFLSPMPPLLLLSVFYPSSSRCVLSLQ